MISFETDEGVGSSGKGEVAIKQRGSDGIDVSRDSKTSAECFIRQVGEGRV